VIDPKTNMPAKRRRGELGYEEDYFKYLQCGSMMMRS
jgi:hypothetical protein